MFLSGAVASLAQGCSHTWLSEIPTAARGTIVEGDDLPLTRQQVDAIPYASLAVRMGKSAQALLILASIDDDRLEWVSHDHEILITRRGRVVRTVGLPQDLDHTEFLTPDPVGSAPKRDAAMPECLRALDIGPRVAAGVVVRSTFENAGPDDLTILGRRYRTNVWEEKNAAPDLAWEFTNAYWADAESGYVWKSIQHVAPKLPPLEMIVFRPARIA